MMSRGQWAVVIAVGFGLFLIAFGGVLVNLGRNPSGTNQSLVVTWGPIAVDFGLFFLVGGLILGAVILESLDVFVRLFLLILAFVAFLLILTNPMAFFV